MNRFPVPIFLFFFFPSLTWAHGEEALFLPIGQFLALSIVTVLLWRLPFRGVVVRLIVVICVIGVTLPFWFMSRSSFPEFFQGAMGIFLIGLAPSVLIVGAIFFLDQALGRRKEQDGRRD